MQYVLWGGGGGIFFGVGQLGDQRPCQACADTGSENPHWHKRKFLILNTDDNFCGTTLAPSINGYQPTYADPSVSNAANAFNACQIFLSYFC